MQGHTDNPDEQFDLVDERDDVIGTVRRGAAHRDPALIHRSVQVMIFARDGRLLLQKRSPSKDLFPGYFCASACGHVDAGEDYETTARREAREELGVQLQPRFVAKTLIRSEQETEMTSIYVGVCDGPFRFHPTETAGGAWMTVDEALVGRASGSLLMTPALLAALAEIERLRASGVLARLLAGL